MSVGGLLLIVGVLLLIVALVLVIFELVVRSNFRSPLTWAVLLIILALFLPLVQTFILAP